MSLPIQSQIQQMESNLFIDMLRRDELQRELKELQKRIQKTQLVLSGIHMGRSGERELAANERSGEPTAQ